LNLERKLGNVGRRESIPIELDEAHEWWVADNELVAFKMKLILLNPATLQQLYNPPRYL